MVKPVCLNNKYRNERIDLQPYGNTISVETPEDNPFTQAQDVEVVTQAGEGMAGPDPRMRSRPIARNRLTGAPMPQQTRKMTGRVVPGKAAARQFNAPAHLQHAGFMPGLGEDPPAGAMSQISSAVGQAAGAASNILGARYTSQAEASRARAAAAQAQAEQARTETSRITALLDQSMMNAGQHKTLVYGLLGVGALALGAAIFMKAKGKKRR